MDIKHLLKYKEDVENKTAYHRTIHFEHKTHYHKQCILCELYVVFREITFKTIYPCDILFQLDKICVFIK
jgi:hypothetical protein